MITTTPTSRVDGHHPTTLCTSTAVRPTPAATNANTDADANNNNNNNNSCCRQWRQQQQLLPSANPNDNERVRTKVRTYFSSFFCYTNRANDNRFRCSREGKKGFPTTTATPLSVTQNATEGVSCHHLPSTSPSPHVFDANLNRKV